MNFPEPNLPEPRIPDPGATLRRFALTVRPQTATDAWHATLVADDLPGRAPPPGGAPPAGTACEFDSPLELLRYLARITLLPPPSGGLR